MSGALRTVYTELALKVQGFTAGIATAKQSVKGFTSELDTMAAKHKERFSQITTTTAVVGGALVAGFGLAIKAGMDFDRQMSEVGAVSNATADDLDKLRAAAMQAGKDTQFSATEAAKAEAELAKAGISNAAILGGALAGSLSLAAAGTLDLAEAADIAAKTMNVFKLGGTAVGHIADVLAAGANKSATDVHELGDALRQGGQLAANAGLSLEDTVGTLAAFADNALSGSDAGTSLKTMLMQLASPTEKSRALMKQLGIEVYDAQGQFIGITALAGILKDKLGNLDQATRDYALSTIFGNDAARSAIVLTKLGAAGIKDYINAVDDQGAAQEVARKKTDNLAGDLERLRGTIETVAISAESGANGGLRALTKSADAILGAFLSLPGPIQTTTTVLVGVTGAGLVAAAGFVKIRQTVTDFMDAISNMGPIGERVAKNLGSIAGVAGRLGAVGLGIGAVWEGFQLFGDWVERKHAPVKADIDKLTESIKTFVATGNLVGELAKHYGENLNKIGQDVTAVTQGMADLAQAQADVAAGLSDPSLFDNWEPIDPAAAQRIRDLDASLAQLVNGGNAVQARLFLEKLKSSGAITGTQFDVLLHQLPQYEAAVGNVNVANTGLAKGFADADVKAQILAGSINEAVHAGEAMTDVWNTLHGAMLSSDKAMLDANKAIEEVTKSFKANGRELEGNSTAALNNRISIEEATKAASVAAQKQYEKSLATKSETEALKDATNVYDGYMAQLRDTLIHLGLTKKQADAYVKSLGEIPKFVGTEINAYVKVHFNADWSSYRAGERANRWGGLYEKAATGTLREASMYSATNPGRFMIAEPQTGGEAFVPKNGDYGRSMSILSKAASWYGANVVPNMMRPASAMQGGGSMQPIIVQLIDPQTGEVMRQTQIRNAVNRGVPADKIATAHP